MARTATVTPLRQRRPEGPAFTRTVKKPLPWTPKSALRNAGVTARRRADYAASRAPGETRRALERSGTLPELGLSPLGIGGLLVYTFATIVALALLDNLLGGRGPSAVAKALDVLGGGISRLVDPFDPLVPRGQLPTDAASSSSTSTSSGGAFDATLLTSTPAKLHDVAFSGASLVGVKAGFVDALAAAAHDAGATVVDVISGRRSVASNKAAGGVDRSNHLTGDAIDARAFIPGTGWVGVGNLSTLSSYGIRSGAQPGFFNGRPDPNHVDTAANQ